MKHFIRNLSLKKKIHSIVFFCIILLALASLFSIQLITKANQKVLYQSVASSLSYTGKELNNRLDNISTMADMFLADTNIQNGLGILKDSSSIQDRSIAYKSLYGVLNEYYFTFRKNNINFMSLYQDRYSIHTHIAAGKTLPESVVEDLVKRAEDARGRTIWITDYSDQYGLFMVKHLLRTEYLTLDPLGTLIVSINVDGLINGATNTSHFNDDTRYILSSQENLIYNSSSIKTDHKTLFGTYFHSRYGLVNKDGDSFFYVKGIIPEYGWDYVCLIPYGSIANSLRTSLEVCLIIIAVSIGLAILMSSSLIDSITRHFDNLILKMERFAAGQTEIPQVSYDYSNRTDELGILHSRFDQMVDKVNQLIKTNYLNKILIKEAQLKALETQMNPHFLYNTLESINWRAKTVGAKDISSMTESLGTLLRITLDQKSKQVPLSRELELVQCYMTIQKFRYEDRLEYEISAPVNLVGCYVLKLTLQPLVENAIRYGLEENTEGCRILITAEADASSLIVTVRNNSSAFEEDLINKLKNREAEPHGFGIGLLNISERMKLTYGEHYGLTLYNEDDQAVAQLSFPLSLPPEDISDTKGE
ncbi:sensor histidine kinase [Lacrimispora sp.]|uniref:sensor histidine kinase n=1 Tax=Lacrimispora sp. TaxID=2719234 RepID=UPI0032E40131